MKKRTKSSKYCSPKILVKKITSAALIRTARDIADSLDFESDPNYLASSSCYSCTNTWCG